MEIQDTENTNTFNGYWGWYIAISFLAENKVWKIDNVVSLPLVSALNHLAYLMDYNREEEKKIKQQQLVK